MSDETAPSTAAAAAEPEAKRRAMEVFARADEATDPEFALKLYLQGLALFPNVAEPCWAGLLEAAKRRRQRGGKTPGAMERMKFEATKSSLARRNPQAGLVGAADLWARDPQNVEYLQAAVACAHAAGFAEAARWLAAELVVMNAERPEPVPRAFLIAADVYEATSLYADACDAVERYLRIVPDDHARQKRLTDLQARGKIEDGTFIRRARENVRPARDGAPSPSAAAPNARTRAIEQAKA